MNITERILYLMPNAKFYCKDNDYSQITWNADNEWPIPPLADLFAINQSDIDLKKETDELDKNLSDKEQRLIFEINYDQEIRLRALETKPAVTKLQYKNYIVNTWKSL